MRLADEKDRRRRKKEREQQKRQKEEKRKQTIHRIKVGLVLLVIATIFIGGFSLIFLKKKKKKELEVNDLLTVQLSSFKGLVEVTPQETGKPVKIASTTQEFSSPFRIKTGKNGSAVFQFSNNVKITLFPESTFAITTLKTNSSGNKLIVDSILETGTCVVKGTPVPEEMVIRTPLTKITSQDLDFGRFKIIVDKREERVASDKALIKIEFTAGSTKKTVWTVLRPQKQIKTTRKGLSNPSSFSPLSERWEG